MQVIDKTGLLATAALLVLGLWLLTPYQWIALQLRAPLISYGLHCEELQIKKNLGIV